MVEEKKKASIFSLYEKEKKITLTDDDGQSVDVLFVKMTQGELSESLKIYNKELQNEKEKIRNSKNDVFEINKLVSILSKDELVNTILEIEKIYRNQISDLYPVADEKEKTQEQKDAERAEIFSKWRDVRFAELNALTAEEVKEKLVDLQIDNLSSIRASIALNNYCLSVMVLDPDTKERTFKTPEDVLRVKDKNVLNKLMEVLEEFRQNMVEKSVRKEVQSTNFTPAGQSQKSSTDSPVSTG